MKAISQKINLIYWDSTNFGDMLSPYLINQISTYQSYYKYKGKRWYTEFIQRLSHGDLQKIPHILYPWNKSIIAIGSVISWGNKKSAVWGAGLLRSNEKVKVGEIYAVRGKYTRLQLIKQGYHNVPEIYGDPAILLPWIYTPCIAENQNFVGVIPNWEETDFFNEQYESTYKVIDLRTNNIHKVIDQITGCKYILSTSLHGIIVAHTYGIPALWIKKGDIQTDGIKFKDYFDSVKINPYQPFTNYEEILNDKNHIPALFSKYSDISVPSQDILIQIRIDLLNAAPFPLNEKIKKIVDLYD